MITLSPYKYLHILTFPTFCFIDVVRSKFRVTKKEMTIPIKVSQQDETISDQKGALLTGGKSKRMGGRDLGFILRQMVTVSFSSLAGVQSHSLL